MKALAILATLLFCSCSQLGPFSAVTDFGTFTRDEKGQITIIPAAEPIVINPAK